MPTSHRSRKGHVPRPREVEGFGAWYGRQQGDEGDLWHRTLIDPGLFARLGRLPKGTRVLDVGCGNGYIARRLAREGAKVVGVDRSRALIALARQEERRRPLGITYHLGDAADMDPLADGSFDLAVANMSLMDMEDAQGVLREVGRVVTDRGRFVLSISHPCFDVDTRSSWAVEVLGATPQAPIVYRKITNYRQPHSDRYVWGPRETGEIPTTVGYHRPLSWYAHALRAAGWSILDLEEPSPGPGFVGRRISREWIEQVPLHLVIEARREPRKE
ncbi:MAG: class I SAM-dependent methyltransferase [Euryarchaeota archaeon]|nr:class I SAM-dependent methyltransferase [Euryarchaeota archaeon]MDE1835837.1 class I SAM-dependent methyltransferase [Euryarchaeota archaeon]MDE1880512.1 class I SAM-dependent methyltransferase [Euryarchaeota archaeon]MDE2045811.1 class I SAM-dependent methyltransferase [Thermoplasmata archaeon]